MSDSLNWQCRHFSDLTANVLYDIMRARSAVFVVEQNCVYLDADGIDQECYHFCGYNGKELVAYTRLIAPGTMYLEASIGRVITTASYRRTGLGKELMTLSIAKCRELFGASPLKIGAQLYLEKFYNSFGFRRISDVYLEDGIEHIHMLLSV
ncbi:MAG: GNAT family N-acetyltransferase [Chitinophagaceae bacterium]|nr:GNAT family N-acetyltransferase [Chitinophagaceae bacterium]